MRLLPATGRDGPYELISREEEGDTCYVTIRVENIGAAYINTDYEDVKVACRDREDIGTNLWGNLEPGAYFDMPLQFDWKGRHRGFSSAQRRGRSTGTKSWAVSRSGLQRENKRWYLRRISFFCFCLAVLFLYFIIPRGLRLHWLLLVSMLFYTCFHPVYLLVLSAVTGISRYAGLLLHRFDPAEVKARLIFRSGVLLSLLFLVVFKYTGFILEKSAVPDREAVIPA